MSDPRIPLTVIGGYLGAGKTTLINRILTGDHGRRIAVIVNDFGDISIDEALLAPADGGIRALANGCVCCTAVDGLATALDELAGLDPPPEHLVIEVSGVGDPWGVAQWGRTPRYELDGVVVVVDPLSIRTWIADRYVGDTVRGQIAAADVVLLSHADDAADACADIVGWLSDLTPAPVIVGTDVSFALLLGRDGTGATTGGGHVAHAASTFTPAPTTRQRLQEWLESAPPEVVRAKGFVETEEGSLVGQRFGHRAEVVRATGRVDPVMSVVCLGAEMTSTAEQWCALLDAP